MNHWITSERLAADRHADFAREASGDARLRAARQEVGDTTADAATNGAGVIHGLHVSLLLEKAGAIVRALVARSSTA